MIIGISGKIGAGKDLIGSIIRYLVQQKRIGEQHSWANWIDWTYQDELQHEGDWEIKKFADKLKDIVCMLLGCTREQLEDRDFKEKELGEEWVKYQLNYGDGPDSYTDYFSTLEESNVYASKMFYDNYIVHTPIKVILTPRLLLQLIGTECFRNIVHPNTWVNALMGEYKVIDNRTMQDPDDSDINYPNWIITDLRFPNELEAVKKRGGITIRVNRSFVTNVLTSKEDIHFKNQHLSETALEHITDWDYVIENNADINELINKIREVLKKENII